MKRNGMLAAAEDSGARVVAFEEAGWDGFFEETPTAGENWRGALIQFGKTRSWEGSLQ
jgi:hypothetical protein